MKQKLAESKTSAGVRLAIGLVVVIVISLLFPKGSSHSYTYLEGSIWNEEDLIAQFSFPVYRNAAEIERSRRQILDSLPESFNRIERTSADIRDTVDATMSAIGAILREACRTNAQVSLREFPAVARDSVIAIAHRTPLRIALEDNEWGILVGEFVHPARRAVRADAMQRSANLIALALGDLYRTGYLDMLKSAFTQKQLALRNGNIEDLRDVASFYDAKDVRAFFSQWFASHTTLSAEQQALDASIAAQSATPNIVFNSENTRIAMASAIDKITRTKGIVKQNERIIGRHERITRDIIEKLDSYQKEKAGRLGNVELVLQALGKVGNTVAILFLLVIFLIQFRKRLFQDNAKLAVIGIIIIFEAFLAWLSFTLSISAPLQYLILVPIASMLITILFDSRLAFYATVVISLLVGALRGNDYAIMLASIIGGSMALYTVRDIKQRSQIFRSLTYILLGYSFAILVDGLSRSLDVSAIGNQMLYALGNAVISPVLTFGFLTFFEKVFGITTDLTLVELSDFNRPLLRMLSEKAPGTFHHSIIMGTLAETAAISIGANSTLARVGAYYHDIGKIEAPEYFVENQMGGKNIHENLKPRQSAQIIIDHVTRGLELGRKFGLPQRVLEFIPAHHGKSIVSFFYELERANSPEVRIGDFQYPGPLPQSKETAIVMLADTIEASARVIEDPTREKFETLIESVIQKRLKEGELDDCELTYKDLRAIQKSFLNILLGIHHNRIKYPTEEEAQAAAKVAERTAKLLQMPTSVESLTRRMKKFNPFE